VEHGEHLAAGRDGFRDEAVEGPGDQRDGAADFQARRDVLEADEELVDDAFVVLHGGALGHGERHDFSAAVGEHVQGESSVGETHRRSRLLAQSKVLHHDLGGQPAGAAEPVQHTLPGRSGGVQEDDRPERIEVSLATLRDRKPQLPRADPRLGKNGGHLFQRQVLHEGGGMEGVDVLAHLLMVHICSQAGALNR